MVRPIGISAAQQKNQTPLVGVACRDADCRMRVTWNCTRPSGTVQCLPRRDRIAAFAKEMCAQVAD
jgi:hypothetical protein